MGDATHFCDGIGVCIYCNLCSDPGCCPPGPCDRHILASINEAISQTQRAKEA